MDEDEKARLTKHYQELYDAADAEVDETGKYLGTPQGHLWDEAVRKCVKVQGEAREHGVEVITRASKYYSEPGERAWLTAKFEHDYKGTLEDFQKTQLS